MNRTDGEPETDVMATAFSTMRKYGMNIIHSSVNPIYAVRAQEELGVLKEMSRIKIIKIVAIYV
ncbi:hypothetical protein J9A57_27330, partial [Klebsiella pneumoniae]